MKRPTTALDGAVAPGPSADQVLSDSVAEEILSVEGKLPAGAVMEAIAHYRLSLERGSNPQKIERAVLNILERIEAVVEQDYDNANDKRPRKLWADLNVGRKRPSSNGIGDVYISLWVSRIMDDNGKGAYLAAIKEVAGKAKVSEIMVKRAHGKYKSQGKWTGEIEGIEFLISKHFKFDETVKEETPPDE
jgi:hypothetical protein